jgi:hypothetical protein
VPQPSASIALAALILVLAGADRASSDGAGAASAAAVAAGISPSSPAAPTAATPAAPASIPVDSLQVADLRHVKLYGPDTATLIEARREMDYAVNQFRRYIADYPPKLTVAVLGTMSDPSRVSAASLREAGVDYIVTDWPARPGTTLPASTPTLSERAGRWELLAFEKLNAKASPPAGKTRLVTDWFDSGLAGLCTTPVEQNRRLQLVAEHIDQRIPIEKLLEMSRPARGAGASAKTKAGSAKSTTLSVDPQEFFDAEALSLSRFAAMREGDGFMGWILEALLAGEPASVGFNRAKTLFSRPDQLESAWVTWVKGGMKTEPSAPQPAPPEHE